MIKERAWPAKAMYLLVAAALVMSLILTGTFTQKVSADPGLSEWTRVDTPTYEGFVLAPESTIIDYALADGGEVAFAVVYAYDDECEEGMEYRLLMSDDYAATWTDITDALEDVIDVDGGDYIDELLLVATDWEDPDFVAVALWWWDNSASSYYLHVFFSTDGGDEFEDTSEVEDGGIYLAMASDLAVSYESAGKREIAIGGVEYDGVMTYAAGLFRCTVTGDSASAWEDATAYSGWDNVGTSAPVFDSDLVTDIIFSPSWTLDKTILVTTVDIEDDVWDAMVEYSTVYLQCGSWGTSEGWNEDSTLGIEAVYIVDEDIPMWLSMMDARGIAGLTLPEDYNGKNSDDRILWVWVNYYVDYSVDNTTANALMRVEDDSADPVGPMGQIEDGELWLTNVSYQGTIAEGEALAGVLGNGMEDFTYCCEGVQVYRNDGIRNMDICCERWHDACKPPTGRAAMAVSYVDEDKAYAVALQGDDGFIGAMYDEGAWSVTFDDGDTWNQLSLIDTYIEYLSDVAVSPDCNKTMLVSVNDGRSDCSCDSVWLYAENLPEAEEYSGKWIRTWCGDLENDWGLLRLPLDETDGENVILVDYDTSNVYRNDLEGLACWDPIGSTELDYIMDLAALDADTLFAIDYYGDVAMFDDDEWQEAVDSEVDYGYTIAVWDDHILVGGEDGEVSYSDDGGETFELLEDTPTIDGYVTVAFDSYFDQNDVVYAAVDYDTSPTSGGIYLWVIGESEEWTDIDACHDFAYTGIVLDRPSPGNPMTSPETGGVLYASFVGWDSGCGISGVARCLTPIVEICCDVGATEWDYLIESDPEDMLYNDCSGDYVDFEAWPDALKICGCLTADSNSHLFALDDGWDYDMCQGEDGTVWTFEDCYAKKSVEVTGPDDGEVIDAFVCEYCENEPFMMSWDRLCDACCYDIEFALDEDFTQIVDHDIDYDGYWDGECCVDCCPGYCPDTPMEPSVWIEPMFLSETTYYYRIRAVTAETDQCIRSWWSEARSFTVAPTASAAAINLVSPEPGAMGVAVKDTGFSWNLLATADGFDWVLSANADLSSPVESKTGLNATAYGCTKTLSYGATYYWQVTAYNEGAAISVSDVGTFTTAVAGDFCCPQCGLCFDTQAELEAHCAEAHGPAPTPMWVWIVIAIGAVLVIVVIVLIFRTRRV